MALSATIATVWEKRMTDTSSELDALSVLEDHLDTYLTSIATW